MPYSLSWFGFTAAILLLQWVPFTGVVLLFFGAPLWPIATINLGFACLFVEALVRPGFRLWLLAPLLYFGSYAIAATLSHVEAEAIDRELRAINAGKTVAFSPARHDIVVARLGNPGLSRLPETLVQHYGLAVSFDEVDVGNTSSTRSQRVASEPLCDEIQRNAAMEAAGHSASRFRRDPSDTRKLCIVSGTENPTRPVYRVSARRE